MTRARIVMTLVAVGAAAFPLTTAVSPIGAESAQEYVVLYRDDASAATARQAIAQAGGTLVKENGAIGLATVRSSDPGFASSVASSAAVQGAARSRPIGFAPPALRPKVEDVERLVAERQAARGSAAPQTAASGAAAASAADGVDPLSPLQWDMQMIRATAGGSYAVQRGKPGVVVGIIDTGIDGNHPDIKPNFNLALSRNFTTDIPLIDGPCQDEPDQSCSDPADVDEDGHGTHVAGIIGAALNGIGTAGVAPNVTLANLRAGQDSGFFFLQPTVDALTFAGDNGVDVVNMSFFTDPWLYNCSSNPADSPAEQLEQRTIIAATQRALDYAHSRGVTLVAAAGNEHTDLGHPTLDTTSPDFPPGADRTRTVDNSCLDLPTEGNNVISVTAVGPSTAKADYSNYGIEQADVSAPGGYFRDFAGTPLNRRPENTILSAYPENVARATGDIDANGVPTTPFVVRDCQQGVCAYYQYLQGTSMAAPHAAGVAALIVSQLGYADPRRPGTITLNPATVEAILQRMATDHACPQPRLYSYANVGRPASYDAYCEGPFTRNGFYGDGIVDALSSVTLRPVIVR